MNKVELLEKMGKLPPNDLGLSKGKSCCPFCGVDLTHNEYHGCVSHTHFKKGESSDLEGKS
jgi:hypothetical protein